MGVEGELYRVRRADLFPPPSDASMIRRSASPSPIFAKTRRPLQSRLEHVIEIEIGPRLVLVHHDCPVVPPDRRPTSDEIETLARLSIGSDEAALFALFRARKGTRTSFSNAARIFYRPGGAPSRRTVATGPLRLLRGDPWRRSTSDADESPRASRGPPEGRTGTAVRF